MIDKEQVLRPLKVRIIKSKKYRNYFWQFWRKKFPVYISDRTPEQEEDIIW